MPHGTLDSLFSQTSDKKEAHEISKKNFEKAVIKTAEDHGHTPKNVVNQAKEDSKDILDK